MIKFMKCVKTAKRSEASNKRQANLISISLDIALNFLLLDKTHENYRAHRSVCVWCALNMARNQFCSC